MRRGLVLGGGGILGAAWMLGALDAISDVDGIDPRSFDVLVGTSAGAFLAALLGADVAVADLVDRRLGDPTGTRPRRNPDARPPAPDDLAEEVQESLFGPVAEKPPARGPLRPASPRLLALLARHPSRINPRTLIAAGFPPGRRSLADVVAMVEEVVPAGGWCAREDVLLTAYDLDAGERVLFGGPNGPGPVGVGLGAAVWASCALPGWFAPLEVEGRRYVDGGAWSVTNVDVAAGRGLDEVYVLAPMVSFEADRPRTLLGCAERAWRRASTRQLGAELRPVRAGGATVRVLAPGRVDLAVIGPNLIDGTRRGDVLAVSRRTSRVALRLARSRTH